VTAETENTSHFSLSMLVLAILVPVCWSIYYLTAFSVAFFIDRSGIYFMIAFLVMYTLIE